MSWRAVARVLVAICALILVTLLVVAVAQHEWLEAAGVAATLVWLALDVDDRNDVL